MTNDTFFSIKDTSKAEYKEKGSRFLAYAYPIKTEIEVKNYINHLRKDHHSARHFCYAYILGENAVLQKSNDDGEPSNTAGKPILGQIISKKLTNTLVVVVRYFGGTLLGKGGLIKAYKQSAMEVLCNAIIEANTHEKLMTIYFPFENSNSILRIIKKEKLRVEFQKIDIQSQVKIAIPQSQFYKIKKMLLTQKGITITE
jgi:uncharacterized YigZ family protein